MDNYPNDNFDEFLNGLTSFLRDSFAHSYVKLVPNIVNNCRRLDIFIQEKGYGFIVISPSSIVLALYPFYERFISKLEELLTSFFNQPSNFSYDIKCKTSDMPAFEWLYQGSLIRRWDKINKDKHVISRAKFINRPSSEIYGRLVTLLEKIPTFTEEEIFVAINNLESYQRSEDQSLDTKCSVAADYTYLKELCLGELKNRFHIRFSKVKPASQSPGYLRWYKSMATKTQLNPQELEDLFSR